MKTKMILLIIVSAMLSSAGCKKNKDNTPVDIGPEKLGPETGKVFHYAFNGTFNDTSGNNMNSTSSNNVLFVSDRFGRANQAASFGNGGTASHILTPSLSSKISGLPVAVSFWFKTSDVTTMQCIAKSDGFERGTYSGFTIYLSAWGTNQLSFAFGDNTATRNYSLIVAPPVILNNDTWYYVAINVRSVTDYDFYINGTKYTNCTSSGTASAMVFNPPAVGIMGYYDGVASSFLRGALDDYRIYTRSLSPEEVSTLYNFRP